MKKNNWKIIGIISLIIIFISIFGFIFKEQILCAVKGNSWIGFYGCCCPKHCGMGYFANLGYKDVGELLQDHPECMCCYID